ncbi:MAG: DUF3899 domain-containing protein [Oscillospiraceae bacterium]
MKRIPKQTLVFAAQLVAASAVFAAGYLLLARLPVSGRGLSDGLAIIGVIYLVIGLFRLVNRMGLFDSTRFGYKKLLELMRTKDYVPSRSELASLADYKEKYPYQKKCLPFLAAAALDILAALLLG